MTRRISMITAIAGAALALGVQPVSAQEGPATLAVSPEVARQLEEAAFDARPANLAVSPELAREVALQLAGARQDSQGAAQFPTQPESEPVPVASSGSEIEWPQIGIGFGIGLLLAVGVFVVLRMNRTRPLAH
jgi:hypothetical protein